MEFMARLALHGEFVFACGHVGMNMFTRPSAIYITGST